MATALRDFSVPLALLLIGVMVYLLIIGKLNGYSFIGSLFVVALLTGVVGVVLPRSEQVSELSGTVAGQAILVKMEKVRDEIYAKAEAVQRLTEHVADLSVFNLIHLGRFSPENLDELLLKERDRLNEMLHSAGIPDSRIREVTSKVTDVVIRDLARDVWRVVPKEIFNKGVAKEQGEKAVRRKFTKGLIDSKVGTASDVAQEFFKPYGGGWNKDVQVKIAEFDSFRANGVLPVSRMGSEED